MPSYLQEGRRAFHSFSLLFLLVARLLLGQQAGYGHGNYEIQVYGANTVAPKNLMVELHSNYTVSGQTKPIDGVYPTDHQEQETLELTQGINSWSELHFYERTGWRRSSMGRRPYSTAREGA